MSKTATCDMLEVAKLGKVVGLKGALRLHNLSDFLAQFKAGAVFKYRGGQELKIKKSLSQKERNSEKSAFISFSFLNTYSIALFKLFLFKYMFFTLIIYD